MRRLSEVLTGFGLAAVLCVGSASAQTAEFSLGGGLTLPLGDFGDDFNTGWHGLAAVSFTPSTLPVGFQVDGMYQRFGVDDGGGPEIDATNRVIQGTVNAVYRFQTAETSQFRPYVIGGVGLYNAKLTGDDVPSGLDSSTDFGINGGAGFDVKFGSVGGFIEGRFHNVFADPDNVNFIPITVGVRLGGN